MALKKNWPIHLTAAFSADGFNHKLAQDFWPEDLFNPKIMVPWHWLKLVWVFCVSGLMQLTVISVLIAVPINLYQNGGATWTWTLILISGITAFALTMALVIASAVWLDLKRHARQAIKKSDEPRR